MSIALINIGDSHVGDLVGSQISGDAIVCDGGRISLIGSSSAVGQRDHETLIDVAGATVIPGFIDSHFHSTFGDFTPRQNTVGYIESYLHGGMTRAISASEVHVPGRPSDVEGVKALAIAAQRCFQSYRPGGVTVHAGSVILEPGLAYEDFAELRQQGVWLAKAGFGSFAAPMDYVPVVHAAVRAGLIVMCHTGGGSIPGSQSKIGAAELLAMHPQVAGHVNGGPTALSPEENQQIVREGEGIALQLVRAGNFRSAVDIANLAIEANCLERILIASDSPTGSGVLTLGIMGMMAEMASLGPLSGRQAITAATGSVGAVYGLEAGRIEVGRPADLLVVDAPQGSSAKNAIGALEIGDVMAIAVAITQGIVRFARSRNTPPASRPIVVLDRDRQPFPTSRH
ncbi:MAG TPA: amidohydrolase family protein [Candidatus Binataceae bacterium]|nr:amidohydrolase family protein [Candidatus Binataceae bacterium]